MSRYWILGTAALALAGMGCGHGAASQATASAAQPGTQAQTGMGAGMAGGKMAAMCPMAIPGTLVSAADTSTGEALTFSTTSRDDVTDLRARVRAMADMHNQHHASGGMHGGMHGGMMSGPKGSGHGGGAMGNMPMHPPSSARVEDTDAGARLVFTPADPLQMTQLQSAVRAHADMMQKGGCGMMTGMHQTGELQRSH